MDRSVMKQNYFWFYAHEKISRFALNSKIFVQFRKILLDNFFCSIGCLSMIRNFVSTTIRSTPMRWLTIESFENIFIVEAPESCDNSLTSSDPWCNSARSRSNVQNKKHCNLFHRKSLALEISSSDYCHLLLIQRHFKLSPSYLNFDGKKNC